MSGRWYASWVAYHGRCGGWAGPATIAALEPRADELYQLGLTARQAGNVTVREYRLHSEREIYAELAGYRDAVSAKGTVGLRRASI